MNEFYRLRREKKIHWKAFFFFLFIGLFIIGLFYLIIYSDFVRVKEIKIEGTQITNQENLLVSLVSNIIEKNWWRALLGRDNLVFWVGNDLKKIKEKIASLASLEINVDLWQQKVKVVVEERKKEGVWCLVDDGCFVFDKEGIAFQKAPYVEGALVLKIVDENKRTIQLGEYVLSPFSWFSNLRKGIKNIKESGEVMTEIRVKNLELREWEVKLLSGLVLKFSLEQLPPSLSQIINDLKNKLNFSQLEYIDFRIPNRVYYK